VSLPQVDFYLLDGRVPDGKLKAACRLSKKILARKLTAYIRTRDADEAKRLDDLMWTFEQDSFVPHGIDSDNGAPAPIVIGHAPRPAGCARVLINLGPEIPKHYATYQRVAEIVDDQEGDRESGRQRYRDYRETGCQLQTHHIKP